MPRPCQALTMPFFSRPRPSRDGLWGTCVRSASSGYHVKFHEDCYQKHTNPPHNDPYLQLEKVVAEHYKKDDLLNCWTSSSDISAYHSNFHEGHSTGTAWHMWINGTAWQGNGMGGVEHPSPNPLLGTPLFWVKLVLRTTQCVNICFRN